MSDNTANVVSRSPARGSETSRISAVVLVTVVVLSGVAPVAAAGTAPATAPDAGSSPVVRDADGGLPGENESDATDGVDHPKVADGLLSATPTRESTDGSERTTVVVETEPGATAAVRETVEEYGSVRVHPGTLIEAELPRSTLTTVADLDGVEFVRPPYRLSSADSATENQSFGNVTSEGVSTIGASRVHAGNYTGDGVTVAVIDAGFDPDDPEIADAVVGTKNFTETGFGTGSGDHGTATAEIVLDTAPDAKLHLVKVQTYTQIVKAANWIANQSEIDVTSISLGLRGGVPLDGSARLDQAIVDSVRNGTAWFSSAGNQGNAGHWNGTWQDPDGDDWLNFQGDDENLTVEGPMSLRVQWSDWNGSDQDYDLRLLDQSGNVVATSETTQSGEQDPVEQVGVSSSGKYDVQIRRVNADGQADFDLFYTPYSVDNQEMEYSTRARTITVPATGPKTTAVGAVNVSTLELQPYSSRGPTIDGRRKPAFVAPDAVTTKNLDPFEGTSAAAPHAAGGAALLLDADPSLSPERTVELLSETADPVDYGAVPNNRVGSGLVNVTEAIRPQDPLETTVEADPIDAVDDESVPVRVRFGAVPDGGTVVVRLRDRRGATVTGRAAANTAGQSTVVTVDASSLADGQVTARAKLVGALGNTNEQGYTAESLPVIKNTSALALDLSQSADASSVPAGGTVSVSTRVSPTQDVGRLSLDGRVGPNGAIVNITEFRVEGDGSTIISVTSGQKATFAAENVASDATVVAEVEVEVAADASTGTVLGFRTEASSGDASASVTTEVAVGGGIAAYANESGVIRTSGLQEAITDWATDQISTDLLQQVITAWTTGEKVT